jgi:hypothetical protein
MTNDQEIYESALTLAIEQAKGRGNMSLLEALLGLHWALAKRLWQSGVNEGIKRAGDIEVWVDEKEGEKKEDPKGLKRPPARNRKKR